MAPHDAGYHQPGELHERRRINTRTAVVGDIWKVYVLHRVLHPQVHGNGVKKKKKHIDLRYHYIREVICSKKIELFFLEGAENPADLFTKNLGRIKFQKFREQLGLEFYSS